VRVTFIGGVGTVHGPVLGAALFVFLREYLALRWVDLRLLIFGVLFIALVLLFLAGLIEAATRLLALLRRRPTARWAAMCRTRPDPREPPRIPHFLGNPCHVRGDRA
jgi:branched-chain amino acid transport system permease protein